MGAEAVLGLIGVSFRSRRGETGSEPTLSRRGDLSPFAFNVYRESCMLVGSPRPVACCVAWTVVKNIYLASKQRIYFSGQDCDCRKPTETSPEFHGINIDIHRHNDGENHVSFFVPDASELYPKRKVICQL